MKTVGIIAEFNPFHKGHAYLIDEAKRITGADYCVAVMSGCFVQRGAPAVCDKYLRTEMALKGGVDAIFELPTPYATASAEIFAEAGVRLLDTLGVVDYLAFGSECGEIEPLLYLAKLLADEPKEYKEALNEALKRGLNYPAAREKAVREYLGNKSKTGHVQTGDELSNILSSPNNILAIEYLKAIIRTGSRMVPITIKRIGSGYHESLGVSNIASATGVRELIDKIYSENAHSEAISGSADAHNEAFRGSANIQKTFDDLASAGAQTVEEGSSQTIKGADVLNDIVPSDTAKCIIGGLGKSLPIGADALSDMLFIRLATSSESELSSLMGITPELLNAIQRNKYETTSFSELVMRLKNKSLTYAAISRALLHIILGTKSSFVNDLRSSATLPYARILGFRKCSLPLIHRISDNEECKLITKPSAGDRNCDLYMADIAAAQIYAQLVRSKFEHCTKDNYTRQYTGHGLAQQSTEFESALQPVNHDSAQSFVKHEPALHCIKHEFTKGPVIVDDIVY